MEEGMTEADGLEQEQADQAPWGHGVDEEFQEQRRQRVQQYHVKALAKEDPLRAMLGSLNAGLMEITVALDHGISETLATRPQTLDRIMQRGSAIELLVKLTRQIDRFAQMELRPAGKAQSGTVSPPNLPR